MIMKKSLILVLSCAAFFGCNSGAKDDAKTDDAAKKDSLVYPFTAKYSLNWQPGDEKNAVFALNSFKKWVDGDVKGAFESFADSVEFIADKFHFMGKKDSLMAMMIPMRAQIASMSVQPDSWLTVYYPDKKDTWVTLWATEKWTDMKGVTDSVYLVDDVLIKDGKIAQIDEKQRMYPPKK
jgi:hypothetical protein